MYSVVLFLKASSSELDPFFSEARPYNFIYNLKSHRKLGIFSNNFILIVMPLNQDRLSVIFVKVSNRVQRCFKELSETSS